MSWVKIDDQFPYNQKIIAAGLEGRSLYITALCYVSHQLTDGFIPDHVLSVLQALSGVADVKQTSSKLLDVRLWDACDGGYMIHDYLDYNPTRNEVIATREARKEAGSLGGKRSVEAKRQAKSKQTPSKIQPPTRTPSPLDDSKESSAKSKETCPAEWMSSLYGLCKIDASTATVQARKNISDCGKALIKGGATLEQIAMFERNWYALDWRGKQGQPPTVSQVRDLWGQHSKPVSGNGHKPAAAPSSMAGYETVSAPR